MNATQRYTANHFVRENWKRRRSVATFADNQNCNFVNARVTSVYILLIGFCKSSAVSAPRSHPEQIPSNPERCWVSEKADC